MDFTAALLRVLRVHAPVDLAGRGVADLPGPIEVLVTRQRHHEGLRSRGIIPLSYGDGLLERVRDAAPDGIDAALDCEGTDTGTEIRDAARLRLTALVDDEKLEVVVAHTFPLDRAAEATRLLAGQHAGGKVVLLP